MLPGTPSNEDSTQAAAQVDTAAIRQKVEIRFEKSDAVRFISHHDLMRAFQRALLRAALPVRLTQGFNPRPRIIFPVALEVGIASLDEVAELELTQWLPPDNLKDRLENRLPPGIRILRVEELPPNPRVRLPLRLEYRIHLKEAGISLTAERLSAFLQKDQLPYRRIRPDKPPLERERVVDLKPFLASVAVVDGDLDVAVDPSTGGNARPLEVLSLLLERPLEELRGIRVTKTKMILEEPKMPQIQNPPKSKSPKILEPEAEVDPELPSETQECPE